MEIRLDARRIALSLLVVAILLTAAHIAGAIWVHVFGFERLRNLVETFDLNNENNVPTFFSAFLLMACATLLALIGGGSKAATRDTPYWRWLCVIFLFLAVDEDASLHELLIGPVKRTLDLPAPFLFAWVLPYACAVVAIGFLYLRFVLRQRARTRLLLIISGAVYIAGTLGFELIGGWYLSRHDEIEDLHYLLLVAAEEFLEMAGSILFIYTLLDYLSEQLQGGPLRILVRSR
jgi:hypothetical protein